MFFSVAFPSSMTGLVGTVGYTQIKADGTTAVARTTAGIVELGNGAYGVTVTPDAAAAIIKWDSGGGTPMYAVEDITHRANILRVASIDVDGNGQTGTEWGPA